eukprot:gene29866-39032_t
MPIDLGLQIADASSASDWVRQSRVKERDVSLTKQQEAKRQAELQLQRQYEEEDELLLQQSQAKGKNQKQAYSAADLKGLKIMHDHTQFEVGQDVVLTLADTNILETDEYGKIVGLQEADDALENVNLADADRKTEREKTIKRNRQPIYSALDDYEFQEGVEPGTKAPILPQYEKEKKSSAKMELGENGTIELPRYKQTDKVRGGGGKADVQSLTVEKRDVSDYYTKKEFSKTIINKEEEGDDEVPASNAGDAPAAALDDMMAIESKRRMPIEEAVSQKEIAAEESIRRQNFDAAVARAQQKDNTNADQAAPIQLAPPAAKASNPQKKTKKRVANANKVDFKSIDFDEDDADMVQALARARKLALLSRTTEFSNRLQARLTEKARSKAEAILRDATKDWKPEGEDGEGDGDEDDEEEDLDDEQLAFLHKQPSFSGGMKTGELSGRAKDSRDYDPSADDFGVKLEYRDEYGRKLTQKEAFRQLSYRRWKFRRRPRHPEQEYWTGQVER